ncbi:PREDICTED: protein YIPF1-like [Priapulus caudatus]|uniref:Protein YIPF n=1 Tax=Priapulus caudatus TaxID=37621 RepID=A0ABM1FAV3_PRICU|nr:PREDICTED: protein YIPF1-like [Priapulus caudatus]
MALSGYVPAADDQLEFQDFPEDEVGPAAPNSFTGLPDPHDAEEKDDLLTGDRTQASFWTFEYYQAFFDVDTHQVMSRLLGSFIPRLHSNYLQTYIRPNPDLYGPFWVCATLICTIAISGDLAAFMQTSGKMDFAWQADFKKVSIAATAIFCYAWLVPLILWALLWFRGSSSSYTFLEIACVYGYSLTVYVPISILWVIPFVWLRWLLLVIGTSTSGFVLLWAFWPAVRDEGKKIIGIGCMLLVGLMHVGLAIGFLLYFFQVPEYTTGSTITPAANTTMSTTTTKMPSNVT